MDPLSNIWLWANGILLTIVGSMLRIFISSLLRFKADIGKRCDKIDADIISARAKLENDFENRFRSIERDNHKLYEQIFVDLKRLREDELSQLKTQMAILLDRDLASNVEALGKQMAVLLDRDRSHRLGDYDREDREGQSRPGRERGDR